MPAKARCLVTGLSWIRAQRESTAAYDYIDTAKKLRTKIELPTNWQVQVNFLCGKNDIRTAIEHEY